MEPPSPSAPKGAELGLGRNEAPSRGKAGRLTIWQTCEGLPRPQLLGGRVVVDRRKTREPIRGFLAPGGQVRPSPRRVMVV